MNYLEDDYLDYIELESLRDIPRDDTSNKNSISFVSINIDILISYRSARWLSITVSITSKDLLENESKDGSKSSCSTLLMLASSSLRSLDTISIPQKVYNFRSSNENELDLDHLRSSTAEHIDTRSTSSVPPKLLDSGLGVTEIDLIVVAEGSISNTDATSPTLYIITALDYTNKEARV